MAEIIQWTNKEGYTLKLTSKEKDELLHLLKKVETASWITIESKHFLIENDDYE